MKHIKTLSKTPSLSHGRTTERFATRLPIEIGRIPGLTCDISATGIYFETETLPMPSSLLLLVVEVTVGGEKMKLRCDGEVVRVDQKAGKLGIAAKFIHSFFSDTFVVIDFASATSAMEPGSGTVPERSMLRSIRRRLPHLVLPRT